MIGQLRECRKSTSYVRTETVDEQIVERGIPTGTFLVLRISASLEILATIVFGPHAAGEIKRLTKLVGGNAKLLGECLEQCRAIRCGWRSRRGQGGGCGRRTGRRRRRDGGGGRGSRWSRRLRSVSRSKSVERVSHAPRSTRMLCGVSRGDAQQTQRRRHRTRPGNHDASAAPWHSTRKLPERLGVRCWIRGCFGRAEARQQIVELRVGLRENGFGVGGTRSANQCLQLLKSDDRLVNLRLERCYFLSVRFCYIIDRRHDFPQLRFEIVNIA